MFYYTSVRPQLPSSGSCGRMTAFSILCFYVIVDIYWNCFLDTSWSQEGAKQREKNNQEGNQEAGEDAAEEAKSQFQ